MGVMPSTTSGEQESWPCPLIGYSPQESEPCTWPGQHSRVGPGGEDTVSQPQEREWEC